MNIYIYCIYSTINNRHIEGNTVILISKTKHCIVGYAKPENL